MIDFNEVSGTSENTPQPKKTNDERCEYIVELYNGSSWGRMPNLQPSYKSLYSAVKALNSGCYINLEKVKMKTRIVKHQVIVIDDVVALFDDCGLSQTEV